jgi:hypothetical protein
LRQFLPHEGLVVADEYDLPPRVRMVDSLRKLEREAALAAARGRAHHGRAVSCQHRIEQLGLVIGAADVRSTVMDQSESGIGSQVGGVVRLPGDEGMPRRLPDELGLRPTPNRTQGVEGLQIEPEVDRALLGRLPSFLLLCEYDSH